MLDPNELVRRYKRTLYARLVQAMKRSEALALLGLTGTPTEEDIKKAYKRKAIENHPDRGGDPSKMVQVNVAKDVLTGVQRATPEYSGGGGGYAPRPQSPYTRPAPRPQQPPPATDLLRVCQEASPHWLRYLTAQMPDLVPWSLFKIELINEGVACRIAGNTYDGNLFLKVFQPRGDLSKWAYSLQGSGKLSSVPQVVRTFTTKEGVVDALQDTVALFAVPVNHYRNSKKPPTTIPGVPFYNPPSGVEWGVVADHGWKTLRREGSTVDQTAQIFVAVGKKGEQYGVLCGVRYNETPSVSATGLKTVAEESFLAVSGVAKNLSAIPKVMLALAKSLPGDFEVPKKFAVLSPTKTTLTAKDVRTEKETLSLKDALAGAGFLAEAEGAGRKIQVEIMFDVAQGVRPTQYTATMFFNGKAVALKPESVVALRDDWRLTPITSKPLGVKINLTALKGGRSHYSLNPKALDLLNHLVDGPLKNESSEVLLNLMAAIESLEVSASKKARLLLGHFTPLEAEVYTGEPAWDIVHLASSRLQG